LKKYNPLPHPPNQITIKKEKMNNEHIQIEVHINEKVDVDIHISDALYAINRLPLIRKWSAVANLITHLRLTGLDEDGDKVDALEVLNDEQKAIVKGFLEKQLALLL
jgi:hypothetical protein